MLVQIFEDQVKKHPDNIAVKAKDTQLTYSQLNNYANRIAYSILEECKDINCQDLNISIALLFEHGTDMVVGMVGALKTGFTYLPLDPSYPKQRLVYMLHHSESILLVTNNNNLNLAQEIAPQSNDSISILNIDQIEATVCSENLDKVISKDQIAYILYTSGSTGKPKGVIQTHQNIWHFITNYTKNLSLTETDRLTLFSAFSHDAAIMDIYGGILTGATLYPLNIKDQINVADIADWLIKEKITIWHSVPTVYRYFIGSLTGEEKFPDLRFIVLGGESVLEHDVSMFKKLFSNTVFINLYGQSESSYNSSQIIGVDTPFQKVTLGEPVEGTELLIVTDTGEEALPLQIGEIIIASDHVALGYLKDAARTEEVFKFHPEIGKLYRTGDLGRLLVNGDIEYIGRKDFQVKIRGYRIELGEIESHLLKYPGIKEGVVLVKEDSKDNQNLCAFIAANENISASDVREFLAIHLPDYMIPTYFTFVDKLPLTPNNKVDRKVLLELELSLNSGVEYKPPTNETEEGLVKIWTELLGEEQIGIEDDFFRIGGNSLIATQLIARIVKEFKVEVPLREIFKSSTVKELAEYIQGAEKSYYSEIVPVEEKEYYSLSSAQKRLFMLNQLDDINTSYNISGAVMITGELDRECLEKAFQGLIKRHEAFRTSFELFEGEPIQRVHENVDFALVDLKVSSKVFEIEKVVKEFIRPFNLSEAPLLRVGLVKIEDEENNYLLMYDMHHIISDGTSMLILMDELMTLYAGYDLPELRIQYKDFAIWQNKFFKSEIIQKQEEYWMETLKGEIPLLNMPLDFKRPEVKTFDGNRISFEINTEISDGLNKLAKEQNSTLNMVLLSVYTVLLNKYTAQKDIIIGSLVAGRNHADLENIIGMFANFLPIRSKVNPENTFVEFMNSAQQNILTTYENQDYPFEQIVDKLNVAIPRSRNPLFDTMLIVHNENASTNQIGSNGLEFAPYRLDHNTSTLDFKVDVYQRISGELNCLLEYNTNLFTEETMIRLGEHFQKLIVELVTNPGQKIADINLFTVEETGQIEAKREQNHTSSQDMIPLVVSSTFTSEPIGDYLSWWCNQLGLEVDVKYTSYNQVFQELLDPSSLISTNTGVNILLIRFEDWIRNEKQTADEVLCDKLERNFTEFISILDQKSKTIPYFIGLFPVSTHLILSETVLGYIKALSLRWKMALSKIDNVYLVDFSELAELYNISQVFDLQKDQAGHLPFSDQYYAAMGTVLSRKVHSWHKQHFKVIVLDCDNTIWQGVCGEDGTFGVKIV